MVGRRCKLGFAPKCRIGGAAKPQTEEAATQQSRPSNGSEKRKRPAEEPRKKCWYSTMEGGGRAEQEQPGGDVAHPVPRRYGIARPADLKGFGSGAGGRGEGGSVRREEEVGGEALSVVRLCVEREGRGREGRVGVWGRTAINSPRWA
jgi:hypothetical protein